MLTRRGLLMGAAHLAVVGVLAACRARPLDGLSGSGRGDGAILSARPGPPPSSPPAGPLSHPGTHPLGLADVRDALLHVPSTVVAGVPAPLVLTLHGAGGDAAGALALLGAMAEERGMLLLAPASRGTTWDAVRGTYGTDARLIDRALSDVVSLTAVDPGRIAVAGFSDGATYALGLGLANGTLFRKIVAFSPGFVPPGTPRRGKPPVFISHGKADDVLPIDRTSRVIVPDLRHDGYDVTYREFSGPHTVPPDIAQEAMDWLG